MNIQANPAAVRKESMRIVGKRVDLDEQIEIRNPYNGVVVGTVPAARPEHVREAFAKAAAYKPNLTRYERQMILLRTAELLRDRKEEFARIITAESGLCWKDSLYEASRAYDVYSFAGQLTIKDDGEIYACDISPQAKMRKIFTTRTPLRGVISAITPFNHPLNMVSHKLAPAIATNNRVVLKPTHMIGGYAQLAYGFNYYGTTGTNRDEFVIVRKMAKVDWLDVESPAAIAAEVRR